MRVRNTGVVSRQPEAWIAPPEVRELRELVRYRAKLVALRSGLKAQVHALLAKHGVRVPMSDLFGASGNRLLDGLALPRPYALRLSSVRELIARYDSEVASFDREVRAALGSHAGYRAIQAVPGVGPVLGAVFVAEIGDVTRFADPTRLCSWAGLTPRHRESDQVVHRGSITKQGSRLVRWAAVEAVQKLRTSTKAAPGLPPHRTAKGQEHRPGRRGPQAPHAGLLRAPRRRGPVPRPARGGGVIGPGRSRGARSRSRMAPRLWAWSPR
jgi:transposase